MTGPQDTPPLQQFLAEHDVPCPRCGYNLRGATADTCPECGDRVELRVGLVEPRMAASITTLVAISVGLGGSALFGGLVLVEEPRWFGRELSGVLLLVQLAVTAVAMPVFLLLRRRLRRAPWSVQWIVSAVAWTVVLGLSVTIVARFEG
jgi:hypothetical protein